jgi:2-polyprenyl-3-methyl-5-hydroxy-6-metoxy-1,4-benzoquinol methylase
MSTRREIHDRVLNASNTEELMTAYSEWAEKYDNDLLGEMGYVAPMIASKLLVSHLEDKGARIMDAGCGTGIVGEQAWEEDGYRTRLRGIENDGLWELQELRTADYIQQEGARCKICLYSVTA